MKRFLCVVTLAAAVLQGAESPEVPQALARKRIGLTLSGGSALGLAHVGVIQWLEEHRIPISYVTGTSMGGLVGAYFATGHSAAESREFIRSIDWSTVFSASAPYENLLFRRKEDRRQFQNSLEFGLKGGFRLPSSVSSGNAVSLVISRIAAPYPDMASFNDLPIPFRCVAVDLIAGRSVVFDSGRLQTALRATMSIPAVFSPLPVGDKLFVDGGALNNLPVDVAQQMGAEYTIAVVLDGPPVDRKSLDNIFGVAGRSISVMISDNELRNRKAANLVLAPDLKGLSGGDFAKYEEFERRGYAAAEKQKDALMAFSMNEEEWRRHTAELQKKRRPETITPKFVDVDGVEGYVKTQMTDFLVRHAADKPLDRVELETSLTRLTGVGPYQSTSYDFARKEGADGLAVNIVPKSWGPPFLNLGINIEGSDTANIRFGFGGRLTFINIGSYASEWRTDFSVGLNNSISTEFYRRIRGGKWFIAPRLFIGQSRADVYEGNTRTAELKARDRGFGTDIGYATSRFSEFRAGYTYDHTGASVKTGTLPEGLNVEPANFQTARILYAYDHQDNAVIPRRGLRAVSDLRWNFHSHRSFAQYGYIDQRFSYAKFFNARYGLISTLNGGALIGPRSYFPPFVLGGPGQMSAYGRGQLRGDRYYLGSFEGLRAFSTERSSVMSNFYVSLSYELGQAFRSVEDAKPAHDGVLGVVGKTAAGVVFFGFSLGTEGNRKIFFRIGRSF